MWRWIFLAVLALAVVLFGFSLIDAGGNGDVTAQVMLADVNNDVSGFARAIDARDWQFPRDFGPHPEFQTEWWYYTGNVQTPEGRQFGFQFTVFRRALAPGEQDARSEWRTNQVYMAHFAVSDIEGGQYYHEQRFSRGSAELAGAVIEPRYRVWLEDWQVMGQDADARQTNITASGATYAVDLRLEQVKPPALQGDNGLSAKADQPGNASYYYSLSRLLTEGTITVNGETFEVAGAAWKDHEFSTGAMGQNTQGWNWFGLQLDDNRELMLGQIRTTDGTREPAFGGLLVYPDGMTRYLRASDFTLDVTGTWTSPHTGATYPAGWQMTVNTGDAAPLKLVVTPLLADQELLGGGNVDYWEGAVRITGDATGYGYAELTGYAQPMTGRF